MSREHIILHIRMFLLSQIFLDRKKNIKNLRNYSLSSTPEQGVIIVLVDGKKKLSQEQGMLLQFVYF